MEHKSPLRICPLLPSFAANGFGVFVPYPGDFCFLAHLVDGETEAKVIFWPYGLLIHFMYPGSFPNPVD